MLCSVAAMTGNSHGSDLEKVSRSSKFLQKGTQIIIIITNIIVSIIIIFLIRIQQEFVRMGCKQSVLISSEWVLCRLFTSVDREG